MTDKQPLGPNQEKWLDALESGREIDSEDCDLSDNGSGLYALMQLTETPLPEMAKIIRALPSLYFREPK